VTFLAFAIYDPLAKQGCEQQANGGVSFVLIVLVSRLQGRRLPATART
jgi:hypothetical protein